MSAQQPRDFLLVEATLVLTPSAPTDCEPYWTSPASTDTSALESKA